MHSILQSITVDLRKLEKRDLTLDLQNAVNAIDYSPGPGSAPLCSDVHRIQEKVERR